jgi:hypothetical protein
MKKFFSNINWSNIVTIGVVSIIAVGLLYPLVKPLLQKIPVIGSRFQ